MKNRNDSLLSIIFMVIGTVIGYLCFAAAQHYNAWFALSFFTVDLITIAAVIFFLRAAQRRRAQAFIQEFLENVRRISSGEELNAPPDGPFAGEISELYNTISNLNKTLVEQNHSKDNVIKIINSMALNIELESLLDGILPKIIEGTNSNWGAFYLYNTQTEKLELKSSLGFTKSIYKEFDIALGEGLVGIAAQSDEIKIYNNLPDDTVYLSKTFLGKIKPRSVMTVPIRSEDSAGGENGDNSALLLLAGLYDYDIKQMETFNLIKYYLGSAVANSVTYERTKRLKNELLFQNQLIQNMNEELENKIEEKTKFLNDVLNKITDFSIISTDQDGYILVWNKGAENTYGYSQEEALGRHIKDVCPEYNEGLSKCLDLAAKDGKCEDYFLMNKEDEARRSHRMITPIYGADKSLSGFSVIIRDVTQ